MKAPKNNSHLYVKGYLKHGKSFKAYGWKNNKAQEVRFGELLKDLDLSGKSILDFGCGMGDIIPYVMDITDSSEYKGVDVVEEFIDVAKQTYETRNIKYKIPEVRFYVRNIINNPFKKRSDIVISSGALNSNLIDVVMYRKKAIKALWDHANETLVFNMSGSFPQPKNKKTNRVYYADSQDFLKYCLTLTPKIIFRSGYSKNDFTITMFR